MKVDVKHLAQLVNLELTDQEVEIYTKQFEQILNYIDQLGEVETDNVLPTYQTLDETNNVWRKDEVKPGLTQKQALANAKKIYKGYFVAPDVFDRKKPLGKAIINPRTQLDPYNAILTRVDSKGTIGQKDLFCTQGVETTAASNVLAGFVPPYSATIVNLLEKNGLKTKYKLNQDAWGHGSSGENSDFGPARNPWNKNLVAGGSSSGSGVEVALNDVEVATGTDTCGSIRMPASYCNLSGIKPTYGALSRYGVIAFASSLDCPGFLARSVKKLREVFNMVNQADSHDSTSQSVARNKGGMKKIKTIGIPKEFFGSGLVQIVKKLVLKAAEDLKKAGFKIKAISLPHSQYGISAYYIIAPTETSSNLARYDGIRYGYDRRYFGPEAKRRIMLGCFCSSSGYSARYYEKAARVRTLIVNDFTAAFKEVEAVLGPVAPTPPYPIGEKVADPLKLYLMDVYAAPVSLAGLPSLALPCGFTNSKLPVGMQLIGPRWSEAGLFTVGEQFQKINQWHLQKPKL